jgi:hypothetical protein
MRACNELKAVPILVAMLVAARPAKAQQPTMPRARPEPHDSSWSKTWGSCRRVALFATPSKGARVVGLVDSGKLVHVFEAQRVTTRPGIVVIRRTHTLTQRLEGSDGRPVAIKHPKRWRLAAGDTVYIVDELTDYDKYDNYVFEFRGREDTTAIFWDEKTFVVPGAFLPPGPLSSVTADVTAELIVPMNQDWWTRVRTASGLTGWTHGGEDEWTGRSRNDYPLSRCVAGVSRR